MTPETVAFIAGPFGATVLLAYISKLLWEAHREEDAARDARIAALDTSNDKLADALRASTAKLTQMRNDARAGK